MKKQDVVEQEPSKMDHTLVKCEECDEKFRYSSEEEKKCPNCGNEDPSTLAPLYQKHSKSKEEMFNEDDFHGG